MGLEYAVTLLHLIHGHNVLQMNDKDKEIVSTWKLLKTACYHNKSQYQFAYLLGLMVTY